jgi:hypothetical protein
LLRGVRSRLRGSGLAWHALPPGAWRGQVLPQGARSRQTGSGLAPRAAGLRDGVPASGGTRLRGAVWLRDRVAGLGRSSQNHIRPTGLVSDGGCRPTFASWFIRPLLRAPNEVAGDALAHGDCESLTTLIARQPLPVDLPADNRLSRDRVRNDPPPTGCFLPASGSHLSWRRPESHPSARCRVASDCLGDQGRIAIVVGDSLVTS